MHKVLFSPLKAIAEFKHNKKIEKLIFVLLMSGFLTGLYVYLMVKPSVQEIGLSVGYAVLGFLGTVLGTFVLSLFFMIIMEILTSKSGYYESLVPFALGSFISSSGLVIAYIVGLIPSYAGIILSTLIITFTVLLSLTVTMRAASAMFHEHLFTVIVAVLITYFVFAVMVYTLVLKVMFYKFSQATLGFTPPASMITAPLNM